VDGKLGKLVREFPMLTGKVKLEARRRRGSKLQIISNARCPERDHENELSVLPLKLKPIVTVYDLFLDVSRGGPCAPRNAAM
jgi:hypothetical protein